MSRALQFRKIGRHCSWFMLAGMVGLGAGCAPKPEDLRAMAIDHYRNRQYIESMATLREVLEEDRSDAEANYYMGLNYRAMAERKFRRGDVTAACRELDIAALYFTQAIKSWPNYIAAVEAKNEALESRGRYDQALTVVEHTAEINRGVAEHFIVLGNEYLERADYDNALRSYQTALATDPESAKAHSALARLYERTGNRALAMDAYRRARELDPDNQDAATRLQMLESGPQARTVEHRPQETE